LSSNISSFHVCSCDGRPQHSHPFGPRPFTPALPPIPWRRRAPMAQEGVGTCARLRVRMLLEVTASNPTSLAPLRAAPAAAAVAALAACRTWAEVSGCALLAVCNASSASAPAAAAGSFSDTCMVSPGISSPAATIADEAAAAAATTSSAGAAAANRTICERACRMTQKTLLSQALPSHGPRTRPSRRDTATRSSSAAATEVATSGSAW